MPGGGNIQRRHLNTNQQQQQQQQREGTIIEPLTPQAAAHNTPLHQRHTHALKLNSGRSGINSGGLVGEDGGHVVPIVANNGGLSIGSPKNIVVNGLSPQKIKKTAAMVNGYRDRKVSDDETGIFSQFLLLSDKTTTTSPANSSSSSSPTTATTSQQQQHPDPLLFPISYLYSVVSSWMKRQYEDYKDNHGNHTLNRLKRMSWDSRLNLLKRMLWRLPILATFLFCFSQIFLSLSSALRYSSSSSSLTNLKFNPPDSVGGKLSPTVQPKLPLFRFLDSEAAPAGALLLNQQRLSPLSSSSKVTSNNKDTTTTFVTKTSDQSYSLQETTTSWSPWNPNADSVAKLASVTNSWYRPSLLIPTWVNVTTTTSIATSSAAAASISSRSSSVFNKITAHSLLSSSSSGQQNNNNKDNNNNNDEEDYVAPWLIVPDLFGNPIRRSTLPERINHPATGGLAYSAVSIVTHARATSFSSEVKQQPHRLLELCQRWTTTTTKRKQEGEGGGGYISIAVHAQTTTTDLSSLDQEPEIQQFLKWYQQETASTGGRGTAAAGETGVGGLIRYCHPDRIAFHLVLFRKQRQTTNNNNNKRGSKKLYYPVNVLRNVAMDHVVTDYSLVLNLEFLPSHSAHSDILRNARRHHREMMSLQQEQEQLQRQEMELSSTSRQKPLTVLKQKQKEKVAWVLPAFQVKQAAASLLNEDSGDTSSSSDTTTKKQHFLTNAHELPTTKRQLLQTIKDQMIVPYHDSAEGEQAPTNITHWLLLASNSTSSSNNPEAAALSGEAATSPGGEPYKSVFALDYDPFVALFHRPAAATTSSSSVPRFWEGFLPVEITGFHIVGASLDKQSWVEELALAGYSFRVLQDSFLIHLPIVTSEDETEKEQRQQGTTVSKLASGSNRYDPMWLIPSMIDEYERFQTFLRMAYGRRFWQPATLKAWIKWKKEYHSSIVQQLRQQEKGSSSSTTSAAAAAAAVVETVRLSEKKVKDGSGDESREDKESEDTSLTTTTTGEKTNIAGGDEGEETRNKVFNITWTPDKGSSYYRAHSMSAAGFRIVPFYFGQPSIIDKNEVSITTQMTTNKFKRLLDLDQRWKGYISIAVYLEAPYEDEIKELKQLKADHFGTGDCNISFHMVFNDGSYSGEFPVNVLRNVAMDYIVTDYTIMLDVDFIPSPNTRASILKHMQELNLKDEAQVMVVPAFERKVEEGEVVNARDLPLSKELLLAKNPGGNGSRYCPFHDYYFNGHGPTNFSKWYHATEMYQIEYTYDFEPYIVFYQPTERLPRFWEYFTGFGKNKQAWIEEISLAGYKFYVLPDAFLIHINHQYGVAKRLLRLEMLEEYRKFQRFLKRYYHKRYFTQLELKDYIDMKTKNFWKVKNRMEQEKMLGESESTTTTITTTKSERSVGDNQRLKAEPEQVEEEEPEEDLGPGLPLPEPIDHSPWMNTSSDYFLEHAMDHEGFKIIPFFFGRPPVIDKKEATLMTQMTPDKKNRLLDLIDKWGSDGYISVAVYLEAPYQEALPKFGRWKNKHLGRVPGNVSIHMIFNDGSYTGDYPVNMLRNVAMDNVLTDYAFMVDVDFIPSDSTRKDISNHIQKFDLKNEKIALIIPAFERKTVEGEIVQAKDLPPSKAELVRDVEKHNETVIAPFHSQYYPVQGPTNFSRWYASDSSYEVKYELNYEPYVVVYRPTHVLPRFWEHFTGFGRNKLSWIEEMQVAGYLFHALPNSFLVHINHEYSADRLVTPTIVRSYNRFLAFVRLQYGKSLWKRKQYRKWKYRKVTNYKKKMGELGLAIEDTDNLGNKRGVKAPFKDW